MLILRVSKDDKEWLFGGTTGNFHLTKIQAWKFLVKSGLARQTELNLFKFEVYNETN